MLFSLAIIVFIFIVYRAWAHTRPSRVLERLEAFNESNLRKVKAWISKSIRPGMSPDLQNEFKNELLFLDGMEKNYFRLKEKYKYDDKEKLRIANDWNDYILALDSIQDSIDVKLVDGDHDFFKDITKEDFIKKEEIEKKFNKLLRD